MLPRAHSSARFGAWDESPPLRLTPLRGYRMVRELNQEYVAPLGKLLPDSVLGPEGDGPKINCLTCHQGMPIPQYRMARATNFPGPRLPEAVDESGKEEAAQNGVAMVLPEVGNGYVHPEVVGGMMGLLEHVALVVPFRPRVLWGWAMGGVG